MTEGTTTAAAPAATTVVSSSTAPAAAEGPKIDFDYDKLASIVEGKQRAAEDSVLKGYFREQGLTSDEMKQAIQMFKDDKASRAPNIDELNQTITQQKETLLDMQSRALWAETQMEAMMMASELGADQRTIPYLMRLADLSSVITDGQVNQDKLKESLSEVLKDLPQLKASAEASSTGFKIGADTGKSGGANDEELARIFGVSKKGK